MDGYSIHVCGVKWNKMEQDGRNDGSDHANAEWMSGWGTKCWRWCRSLKKHCRNKRKTLWMMRIPFSKSVLAAEYGRGCLKPSLHQLRMPLSFQVFEKFQGTRLNFFYTRPGWVCVHRWKRGNYCNKCLLLKRSKKLLAIWLESSHRATMSSVVNLNCLPQKYGNIPRQQC